MLGINIICVGKLKESYLREAQAEYSKRLSAFCKLCITEVDEYALPDNPSKAQIEKGLKKEGDVILSKVENDAFLFALCIDGKQCSSPQLAKEFESLAVSGKSNLTFVIGGSFGLSDEVKKRAHRKLSMSEMTFPHQLARIMLTEQIYRAFQINIGGKYHK